MNQAHTTRFSTRLRLLFGLALLLGLCIMLGGLARPAHAQSNLSVTDCSSDAQLRADVAQANTDNAGDVITFACSGDIKLTGTLWINGNMTLDGSGQSITLDGSNSVQVLGVNNSGSLTLKALTIAHGLAVFNNGDGIYEGGGLFNSGGTVTISSSTFSGNSANADPCLNNGGSGGGFANDNGTVSISSSIFANNSAKNGNFDWDGGGGLASESGTVTINSSSFTNNSAEGTHNFNGGGVRNAFSSTVNITNSTFSGNTSAERGGALHNGGGGTANITNSTFSGNSASNNSGGISNDGTVNIAGSIVAANTRGDCNQLATLNDHGYNLSSDSSCGFSGTGSLQNTNPKLGPLASNGGPTQTLALLKGSPASDDIRLSSGLCPKTDQRGHKRPDNPMESACDIGAYES